MKDKSIQQDRERMLLEWRTKILNGFLIVAAVASLPAYIATVVRSFASTSFWSVVIPFTIVELLLIVLAIYRGLKFSIRVITLLVIGYAAAIFSLRLGGLL